MKLKGKLVKFDGRIFLAFPVKLLIFLTLKAVNEFLDFLVKFAVLP